MTMYVLITAGGNMCAALQAASGSSFLAEFFIERGDGIKRGEVCVRTVLSGAPFSR